MSNVIKKLPNFIPLKTALFDDIRVKRLNKEITNCSGLGIMIGLYFQLLKNPRLCCSYDDIDIIADELRTSVPMVMTVIEKYNLFEVIEDNGTKFFSPILNLALEPYWDICEMNKIRSDIATEKRKQKKKQQLEELKKLMSIESSRLNLPNVIECNIIEYNLIENKVSSSSNNNFWKNKKDFEIFFDWLKVNQPNPIKNERYYKKTILEKLAIGDIKTLENWEDFLTFKKEEKERIFFTRIEKLESQLILIENNYRYISKVEINREQKEFTLLTSYFEDKEITHLVKCKFEQLEKIEKLIRTDYN